MSIPLNTTTITVRRSVFTGDEDPYDTPPEPTDIATGIRAVISATSGNDLIAGRSTQETVSFGVRCDPTDLEAGDQVVDDTSGEVFEVMWAHTTVGLELDHTTGELRRVTGVT